MCASWCVVGRSVVWCLACGRHLKDSTSPPLIPPTPPPPPPQPPGRDVYVDIAGWHLFLRDMTAVPGLKMAAALAGQLGPAAADAGRGGLREADVAAVLKRIPVDVGGGRVTVGFLGRRLGVSARAMMPLSVA